MNAGLTDFRQRWDSRFYWPLAGGGGTPVPANASLQSVDDLNWYEMKGSVISVGNALFMMGQTATAAGVNAYVVIADPGSGLKYKISAWGAPPNVQWQIDPTATGEAETPTVIEVSGGAQYDLVVRLDPDPLPVLEPV